MIEKDDIIWSKYLYESETRSQMWARMDLSNTHAHRKRISYIMVKSRLHRIISINICICIYIPIWTINALKSIKSHDSRVPWLKYKPIPMDSVVEISQFRFVYTNKQMKLLQVLRSTWSKSPVILCLCTVD